MDFQELVPETSSGVVDFMHSYFLVQEETRAVILFILLPVIIGLIFCAKVFLDLSRLKLDGHTEAGLDAALVSQGDAGVDRPAIAAKLQELSSLIAEGANTFLFKTYYYMGAYIAAFGVLILCFIGWETALAFVMGAGTSILAGYIGMRAATYSNAPTAHEAWRELSRGFAVALAGGSLMGVSLVALGVVSFIIVYLVITSMSSMVGKDLYEALAGFGFGASSIALFCRVGGGIYTKAADVGADLSGKNSYGMNEDDPRNPACIADNVGDNVGDVAGMGADLFGSFAEATCAALVILSTAELGISSMFYPLAISSFGIIVGVLSLMALPFVCRVDTEDNIEKALKAVIVLSTVFTTPMVFFLSMYMLPASFELNGHTITPFAASICVCTGLWAGLIIGVVTEYYTSHTYTPVREIAESDVQSTATGIIFGLALGYQSCVVPIFCLIVTAMVGDHYAGKLGIALTALGMLSTMSIGLTIDSYGPISDNAGGIAEMAGMPAEVRRRTDALDAAGNTTAAVGKGFAIGSAALVSLALFGAYCVRASIETVDILNIWVFVGLLYGAMMPYWFSAMTMKSVGLAANEMVAECMRQFPLILEQGMAPDYQTCIAISTNASLVQMIAPGVLVIASPLVGGLLFGKLCTAGILTGSLISGVQLAISMSNSGGAWDNAKKYIEKGGLGSEHLKGSDAHKASVTGDTVGDPLKDTSGPSLNIVVKLSAIISLVFGSVIANASNADGGPFWL
jgi:inorganic pyrophosphatase